MAAAVFSLVLLGGCDSGDERGESRTPRIRSGPVTELTDALLTTQDLRAVRGLPRDLEAVSPEGVELFENPDPRGPCGAKVRYPDFARGQVVGLRSASAGGLEAVFRLPVAQATAFVRSLAADTRMGCPPHEAKTNTGSVQRVTLVKEVDIGSLGDQRTAALLRIVNKGQTAYVASVAVRHGDRVAVVALFAPARASDDVVKAIALRASDRLRAAS